LDVGTGILQVDWELMATSISCAKLFSHLCRPQISQEQTFLLTVIMLFFV